LNALLFRIQRHPSINPSIQSSFLPPNSLRQDYLPAYYRPTYPPTDNRSQYDPHRVIAVSDTVRATAGCRKDKPTATGRSERPLLVHTDSKQYSKRVL